MYASNLIKSFSKDKDYSDQVKKLKEFLSSDIDSERIVIIPSNSNKVVFLANKECEDLNSIYASNQRPSLSDNEKALFFCIYNEESERRFCDYIMKDIVLYEKQNGKDFKKSCIKLKNSGDYDLKLGKDTDGVLGLTISKQ